MAKGEFLGHPKGLFVLFFTEMWERFSYYGMRALLVLYMVNYFKWTQEDASSIYKWYTSLVYLTPLLGGFLADRYLGNKWAIIIGGLLMAVGHFCMAFEQIEVFYAALIFLIIGNGFFKPNMSAQVGRLYPANDPRRDGAYTIFYMGINLGAFLSPIICGALKDTPNLGYHWGFGAAGVGMVLGVLTYLIGLPWIRELPPDMVYEGPAAKKAEAKGEHYMSEAEAEHAPSAAPWLSRHAPLLLLLGGFAMLGLFLVLWLTGNTSFDNFVGLGCGASISALMAAWITNHLQGAVRDRVLAIIAVSFVVIFFWAAFEQAGNAMNIFADKVTNRYVTEPAPTPSIYPEVHEEETAPKTLSGLIGAALGTLARINPVSTSTFQSINAFAIIVLAPLFAWLWVALPRRGINLSIPAKVAIGVFLQGMAFALMIWAVQVESRQSEAPLSELPHNVVALEQGAVQFRDAPDLDDGEEAVQRFAGTPAEEEELHVVNGGRIHYDYDAGRLKVVGVLSDTDRDRILRASVPLEYLRAVRQLALDTQKEGAVVSQDQPAQVALPNTPEGFDLRYAGFRESEVRYDASSGTLISTRTLADREYKMLLLAGAEPAFRNALNQVFVDSAKFKLSVWWLVWFYILSTLGELCLSPVGLSMVSKLAPARFVTMLMGMWLLTSFFGNFLAGLAGESYGAVDPTLYFGVITAALLGASLICFIGVKKMKALMHGVM